MWQAEVNAGLAAEVDELERALADFAPSGDVLELGCGTGSWTRRFKRLADRVTALDASPEMMKREQLGRVGHQPVAREDRVLLRHLEDEQEQVLADQDDQPAGQLDVVRLQRHRPGQQGHRADNGIWNSTYNADGTVASIDGPRADVNDVTSFTYGWRPQQWMKLDNPSPLGDTSTNYDSIGRITSTVDGKNQTTSYIH